MRVRRDLQRQLPARRQPHPTSDDVTSTAPLWLAQFNSRRAGGRATALIAGIADDFVAGAASSAGRASCTPTWTRAGPSTGSRARCSSASPGTLWWTESGSTRSSCTAGGIQDHKLHFNANSALRGGWNSGGGRVPSSRSATTRRCSPNYHLEVPGRCGVGLDTIPFTGQPTIPNLGVHRPGQHPAVAALQRQRFFLTGTTRTSSSGRRQPDAMPASAPASGPPTGSARTSPTTGSR